MSQNASRVKRREDVLIRVLPHVLICMMLATACLLLAGFLALLDEIGEHDAQRLRQQRSMGSPPLVDEFALPGVGDARMLSVSVDNHPMR
ncbi:hypothetical protein [Hydrogenophaga sp.]|uniref:hypothetical protein n=1 Tax=Hydrogenophaga sp. TaxID=1904254 RepID=UPI0027220868|nr:hypothetical protein [Hydrogenophaga sp.]MDO9434566.1 hypothetical protein [Hydrogenophaga sp.]